MGLLSNIAENMRNRRMERQARRAGTRLDCVQQTQEELQHLQQQVPPEQEKSAQRTWRYRYVENAGWHQYVLPHLDRALTLGYKTANGGKFSYVFTPGALRTTLNENLEIVVQGSEIVVSAKGPYVGTEITLQPEGMEEHAIVVGQAAPGEPLSDRPAEQPEKQPGLLIEQVGPRQFLLPKERVPLFLRYELSGGRGSMTGWYDLQPDTIRSQHENWLIEGQGTPHFLLTVPEAFEGTLILSRNGAEQRLTFDASGNPLGRPLQNTEEWRNDAVARNRRLLQWLKSLSPEEAGRYEQARNWDRKADGPLITFIESMLSLADQQQRDQRMVETLERQVQNLR